MEDLTGRKFGSLTVIGFSHRTKRDEYYWNCICDCGNKRVKRRYEMISGNVKSCGCLTSKLQRESAVTHGMSLTPEYCSWQHMKRRCKFDKHYIERGIKVCPEWENSFETFLDNMGPRPFGTSIDRKDTNKGYNKWNCRWATSEEQMQNTIVNRNITINGVTQCLAKWSREYKINPSTVNTRIRKGMLPEQAFSLPVDRVLNNKKVMLVTINGRTQTIPKWCKELRIALSTARNRIYSGIPPELALLAPVQRFASAGAV
jgi:hypothetical protein